jgi:hypothetical protein
MTGDQKGLERHRSELERLNLERIRDLLFESRVILLELRRHAQPNQALSDWQKLEDEVRTLEGETQALNLERALEVRSRVRQQYHHDARASTAL